ncbi:hypothetical protein PAXRUDRAFT_830078 [Paxillus rubicundulus Ve08.2h10]|uniref:Secreted protein n=1 Tax=Paxillus rubicundulus Ve08.2h10 TaxID=930991 RepID=A0A0D0DU14_9AGAM|nr:hypothetical protein PAXRUDRAFT_830078 [Paxillus rubicundulus Ve08.2h10]
MGASVYLIISWTLGCQLPGPAPPTSTARVSAAHAKKTKKVLLCVASRWQKEGRTLQQGSLKFGVAKHAVEIQRSQTA